MDNLKDNLARIKELIDTALPFSDISVVKQNKVVYSVFNGECRGFGLMYQEDVAVQWAVMGENTDLPKHAHENEVEILIVYEGELTLEIGDTIKTLKVGDVIRFDKGEAHHATSKTGCKMIAVIMPASKFYPKAEEGQ